MLKPRIIPVLLLKNWGIEKSIQFREFVYVGSPINAARVFNGRNVDELILLDIVATDERRPPRTEIIRQIAEETSMPLTAGGGVRTMQDVNDLLRAGADRVAINTAAVESPAVVREAADRFGSQCVVVSIDARKVKGKYEVFTHSGKQATGLDPRELALRMQEMGAGEILINSIDRDGTMAGYDLELVSSVADTLTIPVIACGGAGRVTDLADAVSKGHASAVAAGAFFLFYGKRRTVLITYPTDAELLAAFPTELVRPKTYKPSTQPGAH